MDSNLLVQRIERRAHALRSTRRFFEDRGFLEVDAPQLVPATTTEPHIDPLAVDVRVRLESPPERRFLHTSPELALKRIVAAGLDRVYCLGHVFRDGERGERHLPEFTLLEWYRRGQSLPALVQDTTELVRDLSVALCGTTRLQQVDGAIIDVALSPDVYSVDELFHRYASVDLRRALEKMAQGDDEALVRAVREAGHALREGADFEDAFFHVMGTRVEPHIGRDRLCVVERWPRQMAVLARGSDDDPLFAERFEIYAGGLELANAFDELTDPTEQRRRFAADNHLRRALGKEALPIDELFLRSLADLPPTVGIALGFDRVLMLLFGAAHIEDVVPVPFR
ncbi:MAG: EF-P lysine aminoacylase EpmA [Myxococcota bacterium]